MRKAILATFICATLISTGCSTTWMSEAEQIVATLLPAAANLITLVATLQGDLPSEDMQKVQSVGTQVEADFQLIQSLIAQYQKADAAGQAGLLGQIQAAMVAAQSSLNGLLPALHIKDAATQAKVTAVVALLLSEVQSMAAIMPLANSGGSRAMMSWAARQVKKQAPLNASEFVSSYNATMTAKTGNARLDHATSGLRIHAHGKFERWATAGLLK
jgi:hypothetical protein